MIGANAEEARMFIYLAVSTPMGAWVCETCSAMLTIRNILESCLPYLPHIYQALKPCIPLLMKIDVMIWQYWVSTMI